MRFQSTLVIVAPPAVQAFSAPIRDRYCRDGLPAHLTLLSPFALPELLGRLSRRIARVCQALSPLEIRLNRYGSFADSRVFFLEPQESEPIRQIVRTFTHAFPDYTPYEGVYGDELHPHLTLANFKDHGPPHDFELPPVPEFTFRADRLHIFIGSPELPGPWIPTAIYSLGQSE